MKIAFVEPHLKLFGGIRRVIELANRLTLLGHDTTIYHSDGSPCDWMECIAQTQPYGRLLDTDHDVIIYNDPNPIDYELVHQAHARLKVFYILELYQKDKLVGFHPELRLSGIGRFQQMHYLNRSLHSGYLLLTNASWMQRWIKEHLNLDSTLLLGGVNQDIFHPIPTLSRGTSHRILYSGDPRLRKGTDTVRHAIDLVKQELPDIEVESYYGKNVPQREMAEIYANADVFVDGQRSAGWNNPVAEAMSCKTAVVCTDIGGVQDFAFNEGTALLAPVDDSQAMAKAILRLLRDDDLRQHLSDNAYQHIRQFTWDKSAACLEEILETELTKAVFNRSYTNTREDVAALVPTNSGRVLDVGCSTGALGRQIKERQTATVVGIELDQQMAQVASLYLDQVIVADVQQFLSQAPVNMEEFDCIIFADILEHLRDPWQVLASSRMILAEEGRVIVSIPNIGHITVIINLLFKRYWPYRDRGIHDKTHLRFFTLKNLREMFDHAGFVIERIERKYRLVDSFSRMNRLAPFLALPGLKELLTYQYLIVARKST